MHRLLPILLIFALAAGASAGRTLSPLAATRLEAEKIGSTTLLGDKATEAGLKEAIGKTERWKAVHLACHGLIDVERPMLSSLALTRAGEDDGFLTALEVLRMKIPAEALQQAQAFVRGHDKWKHPYFWAAWVLWGLPR